MSGSHETYTRQQGLKKTYDIEYTALRYKILLEGKELKKFEFPLQVGQINGPDAAWKSAVADIEFLRGMAET